MTTKYNHSALGTEQKPLIPNVEFKKLVEWIKSGHSDISNWTNKWTLESFQARLVQGLINERLKKNNQYV